MRISDWSSDVCSSDLLAQAHAHFRPPEIHDLRLLVHLATNAVPAKFTHNRVAILFGVPLDCEADGADMGARPHLPNAFPHRLLCDTQDRTSVVYGKSVSGRVDSGGCRIIKKKKKEK